MRFYRVVAALPLAALFVALQFAAPAAACACGAPAPLPGDPLEVGHERAIISWADGREQIDLQLGISSESTEMGLIFPTPEPATVTAGDTDDFIALEEAIAPKITYVGDPFGSDGLDGAPAGGAPPQVLAEVDLGQVTATTLAASDASGLSDWLTTNGYVIDPAVQTLLVDYVDRGWYFVAIKLTSDAQLDGGLDPIRFSFDSDEPVYPMDLSKAATRSQEVRLYVLAEHRMRLAALDAPEASYSDASTTWAGSAPSAVIDRGSYLTVLDLYLSDPATQATDLVVLQAPDDGTVTQDYTVTRPMAILGIPVGVLAIIGGALLIALVIAIVVRVRSRRDGRAGADRRAA